MIVQRKRLSFCFCFFFLIAHSVFYLFSVYLHYGKTITFQGGLMLSKIFILHFTCEK